MKAQRRGRCRGEIRNGPHFNICGSASLGFGLKLRRRGNGIPIFFITGDYSYDYKKRAESDYKSTVIKALQSEDTDYSVWANDVVQNEFFFLRNRSVVDCWECLLSYQTEQRSINFHKEIKFHNTNASSSVYTTEKNDRKGKKRMVPAESSVPCDDSSETDGVFLPGVNVSIGIFIKNFSSRIITKNKKDKYFLTLGKNGILDMTDATSGSQIGQLPAEAVKECFIKLPFIPVTTSSSEVSIYESLMGNANSSYMKYINESLTKIKESKVATSYDIVLDVYNHILKLHQYSPDVFTNSIQDFLSEQDFIIKFWGPLVEIIFRGTGILPHWGDTTSKETISAGKRFRMDLRLISSHEDIKKNMDSCSAEIR